MIQTVEINGVDIAYEVTGSGEPLVLIMGLGYGRWAWQWALPYLEKAFQVVAFDNRCSGSSGCPDEPFAVVDMAHDTAALMDHLGIASAHVFGVSMGGHIAQELALHHPEKINKLILAACHLGPSKMEPLSDETMRMFGDREGTPEEIIRRTMPWSFRAGWVEENPDYFDEVFRARLPDVPPPDIYQRQLAAAIIHEVGDRAQQIVAPTLVLQGTGDRVVPGRNSELIAETVPGAKLEWLDGAGHLFFIEEPEKMAKALQAFCLAS